MIISGWYKKEIFYNHHNDYHVALIKTEDNKHLTIVGYIPRLLKDGFYHFQGDFVRNNYGLQFSVTSYELDKKNDFDSLVTFLSSSLFKGIGKKTAMRIVSHLGNDAIDKIINDKTVLDEIPGLNEVKKQRLYDVLLLNYESEKIIRFLLKHGLGSQLAAKIYKKYQSNTISLIKENPYRLIDDIEGIGFIKADSIALSLGFDLTSSYRLEALIKYILEEYCFSNGFTYLTEKQLLDMIDNFLNTKSTTISLEEIVNNLNALIKKGKIIVNENRYYLPILYYAEENIAVKIKEILEDEEKIEIDEEKLNQLILKVEEEVNLQFSAMQKEAIKKAMNNKITILTGGPGTGKTTIVNGFLKTYINYYKLAEGDINSYIALVAPTGRAAKKLQETTGYFAQTIHRLLGYQINGEFTYSNNNHLECKLIIIDESSMIDCILLSQLLQALNDDVKIIFVGDINQLPSVGPGEVLKDLISSDLIPTITLDKIHRQSEDSTIITLAHDIKNQIITKNLLDKQKDRNFILCSNDLILENLKFIIMNALEKGFSLDKIQVLAPMYKGEVGIDNINSYLQSCLNPQDDEKKEIRHFNKIFRIGDKVIQLVNRPEKNIMNGDIGYIKHIISNDENEENVELIIDFDNNEVKFQESELNEISLAYCISIHKSQGSEFDIVILVLSKSYTIMLRKKLLYTAVTRAKKSLIILGDFEAYKLAVGNTREVIRQTSLKEKLINDNNMIIIDNYPFEYKPLKNISPYDF